MLYIYRYIYKGLLPALTPCTPEYYNTVHHINRIEACSVPPDRTPVPGGGIACYNTQAQRLLPLDYSYSFIQSFNRSIDRRSSIIEH
jgi:hypothetical protein